MDDILNWDKKYNLNKWQPYQLTSPPEPRDQSSVVRTSQTTSETGRSTYILFIDAPSDLDIDFGELERFVYRVLSPRLPLGVCTRNSEHWGRWNHVGDSNPIVFRDGTPVNRIFVHVVRRLTRLKKESFHLRLSSILMFDYFLRGLFSPPAGFEDTILLS